MSVEKRHSLLGRTKHVLVPAEREAGLTQVDIRDPSKEFGDAERYGILGDGSTDNAEFFKNAIAAMHAAGGGEIKFRAGIFNTTEEIELPDTPSASGVTLIGVGRTASQIKLVTELPEGSAVIRRGGTSTVHSGGVVNMGVDAQKNADYVIRFLAGKGTRFTNSSFLNARVTEGMFGDSNVSLLFYESDFYGSWWRTESGIYTDVADRPDYNLRFVNHATDNELIRVTAANASSANILIEAGGNAVIGSHVYGSPGTFEADYGIRVDAANVRILGSYLDGFGVAGIYSAGLGGVSSIGNQFFWPNTTTGDGHLIGDGQSRIHIAGNLYANLPAGKAKVSYAGSQPTNSQILDGVFDADGSTVVVDSKSHLGLRSYTVATLPSASPAARMIYVSDGTSNKRLAISDGTNWRFPDGSIVS